MPTEQSARASEKNMLTPAVGLGKSATSKLSINWFKLVINLVGNQKKNDFAVVK